MDAFLEQIMAADAANLTVTLGELVEYRPAVGFSRMVSVVIDRVSIGQQGGAGPKDRPSMTMTCCADPITGIDPAAVNFDGDRIMVAYPATAPAQQFSITRKITQQSPGMWTVVLV